MLKQVLHEYEEKKCKVSTLVNHGNTKRHIRFYNDVLKYVSENIHTLSGISLAETKLNISMYVETEVVKYLEHETYMFTEGNFTKEYQYNLLIEAGNQDDSYFQTFKDTFHAWYTVYSKKINILIVGLGTYFTGRYFGTLVKKPTEQINILGDEITKAQIWVKSVLPDVSLTNQQMVEFYYSHIDKNSKFNLIHEKIKQLHTLFVTKMLSVDLQPAEFTATFSMLDNLKLGTINISTDIKDAEMLLGVAGTQILKRQLGLLTDYQSEIIDTFIKIPKLVENEGSFLLNITGLFSGRINFDEVNGLSSVLKTLKSDALQQLDNMKGGLKIDIDAVTDGTTIDFVSNVGNFLNSSLVINGIIGAALVTGLFTFTDLLSKTTTRAAFKINKEGIKLFAYIAEIENELRSNPMYAGTEFMTQLNKIKQDFKEEISKKCVSMSEFNSNNKGMEKILFNKVADNEFGQQFVACIGQHNVPLSVKSLIVKDKVIEYFEFYNKILMLFTLIKLHNTHLLNTKSKFSKYLPTDILRGKGLDTKSLTLKDFVNENSIGVVNSTVLSAYNSLTKIVGTMSTPIDLDVYEQQLETVFSKLQSEFNTKLKSKDLTTRRAELPQLQKKTFDKRPDKPGSSYSSSKREGYTPNRKSNGYSKPNIIVKPTRYSTR